MYGFTINIGFTAPVSSKCVISYNDVTCINNMIAKFEDDKIFYEDVDCIIILDGVILNKRRLLKNEAWPRTVKEMYKSEGELFFNLFRGCFAGAFYDKMQDKWIIFSDQLGQKFIYYYREGKRVCCSSMMDEIYSTLKANKISYSLDESAAFMLLSYGFMLEQYTICKEIKKVRPGNYLIIKDGIVEEHNYYYLNNEPNFTRSEQETIEGIERLFCQAVARQFEKDKEYGYNHLCALSGGLDARMTSFVADELGYKKQLNFTFSQSDYYDDFLPKQMARDMKHEWLFKSLDNGIWLYDVDRITKVTGGNAIYYGLAHGDSLYRLLNFSEYGIIHSGQLGDVIIGSKTKSNDEKYILGDGAYSDKYLIHLHGIEPPVFSNKEIGCFYTRYLNGTNNGLQNIFNYNETCSPFMDLDFLEFCLTIPNEQRFNHKLYKKWIIQKHPRAAKYIWETTHAKITTPTVSIGHKSVPITDIPRKIYLKVLDVIGHLDNYKSGMNPLKIYLEENLELRDTLYNYFSYMDCIQNIELREAIQDVKERGTSLEKIQAVSLLSAIKLYFN